MYVVFESIEHKDAAQKSVMLCSNGKSLDTKVLPNYCFDPRQECANDQVIRTMTEGIAKQYCPLSEVNDICNPMIAFYIKDTKNMCALPPLLNPQQLIASMGESSVGKGLSVLNMD